MSLATLHAEIGGRALLYLYLEENAASRDLPPFLLWGWTS